MAREHIIEIYAHPSIYKPQERKLRIYFSEPDKGLTYDTGILLLIAGFGGHANSNIYKKMRNSFSDQYNLLTIQCDYFGWEFMQNLNSFADIFIDHEKLKTRFPIKELSLITEISPHSLELLKLSDQYSLPIPCFSSFNEDLTNFNDMGIMQALDNISAITYIYDMIQKQGYQINSKKIIAYGHSHGAYLAYLCNAFAPDLLSMIIDNSAWIFPVYLYKKRQLIVNVPKPNRGHLSVDFDYLAEKIDHDKELLFLLTLYQKFKNNCKIISYHGTEDTLISVEEKELLTTQIDHFILNKISPDSIDSNIFKSAEHGLNADYTKLFEFTMENYGEFFTGSHLNLKNTFYETLTSSYYFDYRKNIPSVTIE